MSNIAFKKTVVGIKKEVTEGTPVAPAGAGEYIAIQDDFALTPEVEILTNAELKGSLAPAKGILGSEAPSASFSHYLRASGAVGTAPNFGPLLESCLGAVAVAATERDTVASSTTSIIKVDTGEGADFRRGQALLIKDATNGHRIRCVESVSGDDLTLGFNVPTAPGTGVNLGRAVLYYPVNEGHPTVTLYQYLGNGGAVQMLSGGRVTDASFQLDAGQLINGSYTVEGIEYFFNPIEITTSTRFIDWTDDDGTAAASIPAKVYKSPDELALALAAAMNAETSETITVTYSNATGKFTIAATGSVFSLLWQSGTNTANSIGTKLGFLVAANDTGATSYVSDNAVNLAAPHVPTFDNSDPLTAKDNEVMLGDATDFACFQASSVSFGISTPKADKLSVCAASGKSGSIVTERTGTITISALLDQYDTSKFEKFRKNENVKFQYSFGVKSGGAWVPGKCGALFAPTASISSISVTNQDGLVAVDIELTTYADDQGRNELFVNFL
jgi:hypothetical protein